MKKFYFSNVSNVHKDMKAKRAEIMRGILSVLGAVGLIMIALTVPNALSIFSSHNRSFKRFKHSQVRRSLDNLSDRGLISMKQEGDKTVISMTKNGQRKLLRFKLDDLRIKAQNKWDRKWRLVIFDIPEEFAINRKAFVYKLRELEFIPFQKSVWVSPYPCEDEIDFLKEMYEVRPFVKIVTAEKIDIQNDLIKKFKL